MVIYLLYFMWTVMESIVALQPGENYSVYKILFWVMAICTTLYLFGLCFKLGASGVLALCHGLHHCNNGAVSPWLATMCSALAYKWSFCFKT